MRTPLSHLWRAYVLAGLLLAASGCEGERGPERGSGPPPPRLVLAFRLDPGLTRSLHLGDRWVSPATYLSGAAARDASIAVPVRLRALGEDGRDVGGTARWRSLAPEALQVFPSAGREVTVRVSPRGAGTVSVQQDGAERILRVEAVERGSGWQVRISQVSPDRDR